MENNLANLLIAFITGLTTGGLSCLAVQGGLLASSLATQIEKETQNAGIQGKKLGKQLPPRPKLALPIFVFLAAKLLAYTLLGFLLGLAGQAFQLSPITRAALQIAIGVFMLGSALRMLNVHPIFRYFVFEPPAFIRRHLRKTARGADDSSLYTHAFLGFMTVLIPCGIAQAMMAVALGTANPLQGAALMFAFTLGTSPVFFAVAYFATQLGAKLEKHFMRFVAIVVLILAIVTIDSGITLAGSPISLSHFIGRLTAPPAQTSVLPAGTEVTAESNTAPFTNDQAVNPQAPEAGNENTIIINVENSGYSPNEVHAKAGVPIQLRLITDNVRSCSRAFIIPSLGVQQILEATGEANIEIPAQESGTQIPFSCSMGMYSGTIIFD
jgi:sulfite exporter TauE/SafE